MEKIAAKTPHAWPGAAAPEPNRQARRKPSKTETQAKRRTPDPIPRPEWLSIRDFAERLGCTEKTCRNWISSGDLRAVRFGPRMIRIAASELDRLATPITAA